MSDYDFILDEMLWSYSRLETFEKCPKCFFLTYILKKQQIEGAFGQYGSFGHELLEKYFKEELMCFELEDKFINEYTSKITAYFPPIRNGDLSVKYFEQGKEYFNNFNGIDDCYEILGVEAKYNYKISNYNFTGIIDLELKHKDGWLEILDHKSKSKQDKTRLSKKDNKTDYIQLIDNRYIPFSLAIQLYLYCVPFKEKYGEYPRYFDFNMFRIQDWYKFEFNMDDFNKSINWVNTIINNIYNESKWLKGKDLDNFWCDFVCGTNCYCENSNKFMG